MLGWALGMNNGWFQCESREAALGGQAQGGSAERASSSGSGQRKHQQANGGAHPQDGACPDFQLPDEGRAEKVSPLRSRLKPLCGEVVLSGSVGGGGGGGFQICCSWMLYSVSTAPVLEKNYELQNLRMKGLFTSW